MDNISRRRSSEEDGSCTTSMYLSFDAESTMSSACYKTLEAMTDISTMSALSIIDDHDDNKHMNSTLENQDSQVLSPLKTVKKMDVMNVGSPLRALPKNIMREYKALSSTPSREQLMKSVDVTRGSDASRCVDLGLAFLGVEDEKPAFFPTPQKHNKRPEDNKENAIPDSTDVSAISVSSSIDIVSSLSEKRFNSISTTGSLTGDESETAISVIEKRLINSITSNNSLMCDKSLSEPKHKSFNDNMETTPKAKVGNIISDVEMYEEGTEPPNKNTLDKTPNGISEGIGKIDTIKEDEEKQKESTPKPVVLKETKPILSKPNILAKPKIAVLSSKSTRRSVCEPNLQTNKPSRILNTGNKRQSLLPVTNKKTTASLDAENEIPLLMNKILKIANTSENSSAIKKTYEMDKDVKPLEKQPTQSTDKRRSLMSLKGRTSLMPTTSIAEKRAFHRMSVVVKTTLNSPARKIARKSVNNIGSTQRRSMVATKNTQTMRMSTDTTTRRSMIPSTNKSSAVAKNIPLPSIKEIPSVQQRNSIYLNKKSSDKESLKNPLNSDGGTVRQKIEQSIQPSFTCSVCKEKFRVKSLLDAHKRSHEGGVPLSNVRKPIPNAAPNISNASSINIDNKCKYCDKKFALVRALHIHLLQNCSKIPPSEKRKLEFTEMNHVEKAKLPSVFHHNNTNSNMGSTQAAPRGLIKPSNFMQNPKAIVEQTKEKDLKNSSTDLQSESQTNVNANANQTICSSTQKLKKPAAHSGVYRTPSKTVPCHVCKLTFKSILDYTNHSLASHGSKTQE